MRSSPDAAHEVTTGPTESPPRRRVLIIHNPNAGRGRRRHRLQAAIAELESLGAQVEVKLTVAAGDAIRYSHAALASAATGEGPDVVVAAGGDGTINAVVNGLAGGALPLALLPLGTANVLAAEIGLPDDVPALVRTIRSGPAVPIHLGEVNGRRFTLMAGVGMDAEIVASVSPRLKRRAGKAAYAVAALIRWLKYRPHRYRIEVDGVLHEAAAAVFANGHYYAGRFVCAEEARLTDPHLHVCLFETPGRWHMASYTLALLCGFLQHLKSYRVITGREIAIADDDGRPVQGDGDVVARLPVRIRIADETLPLVMPAAG